MLIGLVGYLKLLMKAFEYTRVLGQREEICFTRY